MNDHGGIPWSAEAERELRRKIRNTWFTMWMGLLGGLLGLAIMLAGLRLGWPPWQRPWQRFGLAVLGSFLFGYGVTRLYALALLREHLGEEMRRLPSGEIFEGSGMLANKPRITSRLTEWIQHISCGHAFSCKCGKTHSWRDSQWIPNYDQEVFAEEAHPGTVDPGGGRYVILCDCGLGHFKLKLATEETLTRDAAQK